MPTPHRLRAGLSTIHAHRSYVANGAYGLFAALVCLLTFLPTGVSATRQTISCYALSPEGALLRLAFSCLAIGSGIAAYEFWRSITGLWGRLIAGLTAVWVIADVIDTVINVNPVGAHTIHGQIHTVVAVVAFSAVAATVLAFVGWVRWHAISHCRLIAIWASVLALVTVIIELAVTATSATFMAGTAERVFFVGALAWMVAARHTVARSLSLAPRRPALTA